MLHAMAVSLQIQPRNSQHAADSDDIHMEGLPFTTNSDKDTRPPCNIALTLSWGVCSVMGPPSSRGLRACSTPSTIFFQVYNFAFLHYEEGKQIAPFAPRTPSNCACSTSRCAEVSFCQKKLKLDAAVLQQANTLKHQGSHGVMTQHV